MRQPLAKASAARRADSVAWPQPSAETSCHSASERSLTDTISIPSPPEIVGQVVERADERGHVVVGVVHEPVLADSCAIESAWVAGVTSTAAGTPTAALRSTINPMSAARNGAVDTGRDRAVDVQARPAQHELAARDRERLGAPTCDRCAESANANATAF